MSESDNYFVQHWRGELSLGASYWLNGFLGTILIITVSRTLDAAVDSMSLELYAALSLLVMATAILISIWQFVGVWRSASNHGGIWAALAKVGVLIGIIRCVLVICQSDIPQSQEMVSIIEGDNGLPPFKIWALPGGTEVEFSGGIRAGCAEQLESILSATPQAKVLRIESPGGRIVEAKKMMRLVREHALITYTSEECLSAATLVLLSGTERIVDVKAKVGFHAGKLAGVITRNQQREMDDLVRSTMQLAGVAQEFTSHVLATPPNQMWFPTFSEMLVAGVVTSQSFGDQFAPKFPPKDSGEWRRRNIAARTRVTTEYPDVSVANSPLNRAFVDEYKYQKVTDPAFLDNPEFPLEIIKILQATHRGLASPVPERTSGP